MQPVPGATVICILLGFNKSGGFWVNVLGDRFFFGYKIWVSFGSLTIKVGCD